MKTLEQFYESYVSEGRRPGSKNKAKDAPVVNAEDAPDPKKVVVAGKVVPVAKADKVKPGVPADKNGTKGVYEFDVDEPQGADADGMQWTLLDPHNMSRNQKKLANRFSSKRDFFVMGEAGWGKTAEITSMAHKFGYTVITVYLDKAEACDLDGIPTAVEENGVIKNKKLMPGWAAYMKEHMNTKFLLFFDEMNQAAPDVQNALMPIILKKVISNTKFDNFIVGAAGNLKEENTEGVSDLSGPLESRLHPFIWEVRTPDTWASHFAWAHKKYDDELGAAFIDKVASLQDYWESPRDITQMIYEWAIEAKESGKVFLDAEDLKEELLDSHVIYAGQNKDDRTFQDDLGEFCDWLIAWAENGGKNPEEESTADRDEADEEKFGQCRAAAKQALIKGYLLFEIQKDEDGNEFGDNKRHLCTLENINKEPHGLMDPVETGITAEVLEHIVDEIKAEGKTIKYPTWESGVKDAKKNGWVMDMMNTGYLINHVLNKIGNENEETSTKTSNKTNDND